MRISQLLSPRALALGTALAVGAATAEAQPIGTLNTAGSFRFTNMGGNLFINILPRAEADGQVVADPFAQTGDFESVAGQVGRMRDFNPSVGANSVPNFLTVGPFIFDLGFVGPGTFGSGECGASAASGQTCTVAGTAINQVNLTANQSTFSFRFTGSAREGEMGATVPFRGLFTAQFNRNFQDVNRLAREGGIETTFSATITTVPEPATVTLMGVGVLALAGVAARRRRATA